MSGHSKWATIKHKKAATDKARGKLFAKLLRQVEVAARGGAATRRPPAARCSRGSETTRSRWTRSSAIKRGTGELEGVTYEEVTYEATPLEGWR